MAVELCVLQKFNFHLCAVAVKVVAGQVDKHGVLGILLGVGQQSCCSFGISLGVALAACGARYGVDVGHAIILDAAVRFGRRAEYAKSAKVEVKQVGRGVDAAQGTVKFKVVALIMLYKAA